jgi:hypothetical protein
MFQVRDSIFFKVRNFGPRSFEKLIFFFSKLYFLIFIEKNQFVEELHYDKKKDKGHFNMTVFRNHRFLAVVFKISKTLNQLNKTKFSLLVTKVISLNIFSSHLNIQKEILLSYIKKLNLFIYEWRFKM